MSFLKLMQSMPRGGWRRKTVRNRAVIIGHRLNDSLDEILKVTAEKLPLLAGALSTRWAALEQIAKFFFALREWLYGV